MKTCVMPLTVARLALTNVVVRDAPFHSTVAPDTKLAPSAVSVKAGPPAVAVLGESAERATAVDPPVTVKFSRLDAWEVVAIRRSTGKVPATARSEARM